MITLLLSLALILTLAVLLRPRFKKFDTAGFSVTLLNGAAGFGFDPSMHDAWSSTPMTASDGSKMFRFSMAAFRGVYGFIEHRRTIQAE